MTKGHELLSVYCTSNGVWKTLCQCGVEGWAFTDEKALTKHQAHAQRAGATA